MQRFIKFGIYANIRIALIGIMSGFFIYQINLKSQETKVTFFPSGSFMELREDLMMFIP